jgi:hypothetical protein
VEADVTARMEYEWGLGVDMGDFWELFRGMAEERSKRFEGRLEGVVPVMRARKIGDGLIVDGVWGLV